MRLETCRYPWRASAPRASVSPKREGAASFSLGAKDQTAAENGVASVPVAAASTRTAHRSAAMSMTST